MSTEQVEANAEAQLDALEAQLQAGEIPEGAEVAEESEPEVEVQPDPAEVRAKADGHVSYDDWVASGKDPRKWRPAEEFNRRGDMLRTPKPELIERVEALTRQSEENARLMHEQLKQSRVEREQAFIEGQQSIIRQAQADKDAAFNVGDRNAYAEADRIEREAQARIGQRTAPQNDPELIEWQNGATWFRDGFDANNQPKTTEVETFLVHQRDYMMRNPQAKIIDSVRYAEGKARAAFPGLGKPKTPQARMTSSVDPGQRVARPAADPLTGYSQSERTLIAKMAKDSGKTIAQYVKEIGG